MTMLLYSFAVFLLVVSAVFLGYGIWIRFFDPDARARKERLRTVRSAVEAGAQSSETRKKVRQDSPVEIWLSQNAPAFRWLERLVRHADSPLKAGQVAALIPVLFGTVLFIGSLRYAGTLPLLGLSAGVASLPIFWLMWLAAKRRKAFDDKLPEALDHITRALRAGHSLTSSIGMVGKEYPDPIGGEFRVVFDEIGFGIPFRDAIGELGERVPSADLKFFVASLIIQHETGGNLTELLDGLSKTIRKRIKLRGKIRTLASEGRASGWVLGSMPFVITAVLSLVNRDYISTLWTTPEGVNLIYISGALMIFGFFVMKRIVNIKV
ncbi:type II secretion system F family protein [Chlorobium sp. N1]|uniref:type II secretion system F family protein n=1 Tax=Chlorobium sp. N1 TaxID=2491138 RepID=UPI00103C90A2|nr:type II secretion system F family protein [Chlorobium sp. N1]TCD47235.1 type II secretion system F family protein [Chlorobium sp. N1]